MEKCSVLEKLLVLVVIGLALILTLISCMFMVGEGDQAANILWSGIDKEYEDD